MKIEPHLGLLIIAFISTSYALPFLDDHKYWTFEQWKKSLPVQERARKRSPSLQQQYKEISIDTGKLYNDFVKAFASKSKNKNNDNEAERRTLLKHKSSGPSIANFDEKDESNSENSQQRQYVTGGTSSNSPTAASFDPFLKNQAFVKNKVNSQTQVKPNVVPGVSPAGFVPQNKAPPAAAPPAPPGPLISSQVTAPSQIQQSQAAPPPPAPFTGQYQSLSPPAPVSMKSAQPVATPAPMVTYPQTVTSTAKAPVTTPLKITKPQSTSSFVSGQAIKPTALPFSKGNQLNEPILNLPGAFDIQAFDAEVVPDGKGGMKILDVKSTSDGKAIPKTTMKQVSGSLPKGSNRPNVEKVLNNPRNTPVKSVATSSDKQSGGGVQAATKRVYSLGDHIFSDIGCYLDKWIRAIPTLEGNHPLLMDSDYKARSDPLQKCAEAALDKNLKVFALQNGGQCFAGVNGENRYNIYGTSDLCKDDGLGGSWSNEVYIYNNDPRFNLAESPKHKTGGAKDIFPEVSNNEVAFEKVDQDDDYDRNLLKEEQELRESDKEKPKPDGTSPFKGTLAKIVNKAVNKQGSEHESRKKHALDLLKSESSNEFDMVKVKPAGSVEETKKPKKLIDLFKSKSDNDNDDMSFSAIKNKLDGADPPATEKAEAKTTDKNGNDKEAESLKAVKELFKSAMAEKNKPDIMKETRRDKEMQETVKNAFKDKLDPTKDVFADSSETKEFDAKEKGIENDKERDRELERQKERERDKEKEREKEVEKVKAKELEKEEEKIKELKSIKDQKEKEEKEQKEKEENEKKEKQDKEQKEKQDKEQKEKEEKEKKEREEKEKKANETKQHEVQQKSNATILSHIVSEEKPQDATVRPFPLGASVTHGNKPPCICPDKICSSKLDLAFVIDASAGSEQGGKDKMAETMEFGRRVASAFKVAPEESRVGLVTYATDAQIMMNFHRFSDPDALTEARNAVRVKPHTGKYTGQALALSKEGLFDVGHRSDALDVLILMTDGPSSDDVTEPARALRDMGVKIICVGIGPQIDKAQLNDMASDPDEDHVFTADYDNLGTIIRRTQKAACVGGTLRDPINSCNCDGNGGGLDRESAAFYNVYKASVETPFMTTDEEVTRYDRIPKPQYPKRYTRADIIRTGKQRSLPLDNPHPRFEEASPLVELSLKDKPNPSSREDVADKTNSQGYIQAVATSPDEVYIPDQSSRPVETLRNNFVLDSPTEVPLNNRKDVESRHDNNQEQSEELYRNVLNSEASHHDKPSIDEKNNPIKQANEELVDDYIKNHKTADQNSREDDNSKQKFTEAETLNSQNKKDDSTKDSVEESKASDLINDDHFAINSDGKKHFFEEEQLLSNSKPHGAAGGAHHLPLETLQKQSDDSEKSDEIEQKQAYSSAKINAESKANNVDDSKKDYYKAESGENADANSEKSDEPKGLPLSNPGGELTKEELETHIIKDKDVPQTNEKPNEPNKSDKLDEYKNNKSDKQEGFETERIDDKQNNKLSKEEKGEKLEKEVDTGSSISTQDDPGNVMSTQQNNKKEDEKYYKPNEKEKELSKEGTSKVNSNDNLNDLNSFKPNGKEDEDVTNKGNTQKLYNDFKTKLQDKHVQQSKEVQEKAEKELELFEKQRRKAKNKQLKASYDSDENDQEKEIGKGKEKDEKKDENELKIKKIKSENNLEEDTQKQFKPDEITEKNQKLDSDDTEKQSEKETEKDLKYYPQDSLEGKLKEQNDIQKDLQKDVFKVDDIEKDVMKPPPKDDKPKEKEKPEKSLEKEDNKHLSEHEKEMKRLRKKIKDDTKENEKNRLNHEANTPKDKTNESIENKDDQDIMNINGRGNRKGDPKKIAQLTEDPTARQNDIYDYSILKQPELTDEDKEQLHAIQTTLMNADSQYLSNGPLKQFEGLNNLKANNNNTKSDHHHGIVGDFLFKNKQSNYNLPEVSEDTNKQTSLYNDQQPPISPEASNYKPAQNYKNGQNMDYIIAEGDLSAQANEIKDKYLNGKAKETENVPAQEEEKYKSTNKESNFKSNNMEQKEDASPIGKEKAKFTDNKYGEDSDKNEQNMNHDNKINEDKNIDENKLPKKVQQQKNNEDNDVPKKEEKVEDDGKKKVNYVEREDKQKEKQEEFKEKENKNEEKEFKNQELKKIDPDENDDNKNKQAKMTDSVEDDENKNKQAKLAGPIESSKEAMMNKENPTSESSNYEQLTSETNMVTESDSKMHKERHKAVQDLQNSDNKKPVSHVKEDTSQIIKFNHEDTLRDDRNNRQSNKTSHHHQSQSEKSPNKDTDQIPAEAKGSEGKEGKFFNSNEETTVYNSNDQKFIKNDFSSDKNILSSKLQTAYEDGVGPNELKKSENMISKTMQTIANNELPPENVAEKYYESFKSSDRNAFSNSKHDIKHNERTQLSVDAIQQSSELPEIKEIDSEHFTTPKDKWKDISEQNFAKDIQPNSRGHDEDDLKYNYFDRKKSSASKDSLNKLKGYGDQVSVRDKNKSKTKVSQRENSKKEEYEADNYIDKIEEDSGKDTPKTKKQNKYKPFYKPDADQALISEDIGAKIQKGLDVMKLISQHKEKQGTPNKEYFYYGKGTGVQEISPHLSMDGKLRLTVSEKKTSEDKNSNKHLNSDDADRFKLKEKLEQKEQNENDLKEIPQPENEEDIEKYPTKGTHSKSASQQFLNQGTQDELKERQKYVESRLEKSSSLQDEAKVVDLKSFSIAKQSEDNGNNETKFQSDKISSAEILTSSQLLSSEPSQEKEDIKENNNLKASDETTGPIEAKEDAQLKKPETEMKSSDKSPNLESKNGKISGGPKAEDRVKLKTKSQESKSSGDDTKEKQFEYTNKNEINNNEVSHKLEADLTRKRITEHNKFTSIKNPESDITGDIEEQYTASKGKSRPDDLIETSNTDNESNRYFKKPLSQSKDIDARSEEFVSKDGHSDHPIKSLYNTKQKYIENAEDSKDSGDFGKSTTHHSIIKDESLISVIKEDQSKKKFIDTESGKNEIDNNHSLSEGENTNERFFTRESKKEEKEEKQPGQSFLKEKILENQKDLETELPSRHLKLTRLYNYPEKENERELKDLNKKVKETEEDINDKMYYAKSHNTEENGDDSLHREHNKIAEIHQESDIDENVGLKEALKHKYAQFVKQDLSTDDQTSQNSELGKLGASRASLESLKRNNEIQKSDDDIDYEPVTLRKEKHNEEIETSNVENSKFIPYQKEKPIDAQSEKRTPIELVPSRDKSEKGVVTIESSEIIAKHHIPRIQQSQSTEGENSRPNNVNAIKKDTTDKGILTRDPFLDATHYWAFETRHSVLTQDVVTGHNAILMEKADIKSEPDFGEFASTLENGSYIIAGDFKGTCFSDPDKCIMNGMTIAFLCKLNESMINRDQDAYILSSGGQSKKSRGFAFLYFHGNYTVCISTKTRQWKMHLSDVPLNKWIHITFVWRNNEALIYYLNGEKKQSCNGTAVSRPKVDYTILTISRPNNAVNPAFMYPLEMSGLGLWDKPLRGEQCKSIVKSLMMIHSKNKEIRRKRSKILARVFEEKKNKRQLIKHV